MAAEDIWPAEVVLGALPGEPSGDARKYHLIAELARGGMGIVYLAVRFGPRGFHKLVVLKELHGRLSDKNAAVTMFMVEARLAARLNHPNVVQTIEVGADRGRCFIAMEYLDGQPLIELVQRALRRAKRIPLPMHLGIVIDVLSALEYAHELSDIDETPLGLVHCDVSPHNVFVTYEGQIKLVDFGISKTIGQADEARAGVLAGKARYMAPEQAAGARPDRRADIFAVGVMLWEAIVGRRPWEGQPDSVVLKRLASGAVPHLREAWPHVDPGLGAIVDRAMNADPAGRYATALDMREDIECYIRTRRLPAPSPRMLGATVSKLFAEERETRRALIETRLRELTEQQQVRPIMRPENRAAIMRAENETTLETPAAFDALPSSNTAPSVSLSQSPAGMRSSRALAAVAAIGLAGLVALASMAVNVLDSARHRAATVGAVASALVPFVSPGDMPKTSHIVVIATPAYAQIFADDVAVPNPYVVERISDANSHRLRAEAPGYESKARTVTFADDTEIELALARTPPTTASQRDVVLSPPPQARCSPPYVVDSSTGKKRWRLDCL